METPLLTVDRVSVTLPGRRIGVGMARAAPVTPVKSVSFRVDEGEVFGIVGESGSGKTVLLRTLIGLFHPSAGEIAFRGQALSGSTGAALKAVRRDVQLVFQNPYTALHPQMSIQQILLEPLRIHGVGSREERLRRVHDALPKVGLNPAYLSRYPGQLSGGQRQRVGLARSLVLDPKLLLLDEPVSALDVSIQAQVLNLLQDLRRDLALTYVVVSHDLNVIRYLADRVAVMLQGTIVESGPADQVYARPQHPYTHVLLEAVPSIRKSLAGQTAANGALLAGDRNPPLGEGRPGCPFYGRCVEADAVCWSHAPRPREAAPGQWVACHRRGTDPSHLLAGEQTGGTP